MNTRREVRELKAQNEKLENKLFWVMVLLGLVLMILFSYHSRASLEIDLLRKELSAEQTQKIDQAIRNIELEEL